MELDILGKEGSVSIHKRINKRCEPSKDNSYNNPYLIKAIYVGDKWIDPKEILRTEDFVGGEEK